MTSGTARFIAEADGNPLALLELRKGAMPVGAEMRSGGGAFTGGPTAQARVQQGRWQVRLVERADVGAGRDDLVDLVEDLVGERDVGAGEQVVELLHRVRPDDRAGHAGMGDREGQ